MWGPFFIINRFAPILEIALFFYLLPIFLFIYDVCNVNIVILSIHDYISFFIALFFFILALCVGERHVKKGCTIQRNSLYEEMVYRYSYLHQHSKDVFNF